MKIEITEQKRPVLSEEAKAEIQRVIKQYPEGRQKSAILRVMHIVEEEAGGWLSPDTMDMIAEILSIEPIEVYEVATFYTMFNLQPVGKYVFEVCRTGPCMLVGSDNIITYLENKLNIKVGETTTDGMFTLKTAECLGACGYGPMLQCGEEYHEYLTPEKVDELIEACRRGEIKGNKVV
ncbi:NADH-quinone oxidoreductase subunit NuoE [Crocinitomicaceae bacterium CZZ-1]|uniref:NADH-quinone oxidoreductase subunit NuoE n=1 Tax=Taishania pollutisoli TaxID=2766479 RepID=A0A8J6TST6_9FLAO|nr:NADH-quinone oxidoreductase subunit NuoE [Taishania pollutisoli]MBC9811679.1 NADH-quinone oxidoreductase subunit NuoE [Taishania pollutisoli]MBX2948386.1 NADH-quinone oxidoreductase subunit NuoE [Crocinitomicaceae bacterium]NGF75484.1 NADH-quinone oxidoreductase subunit NuoE [Fluviicola sp. SGL-29]